MSTNTISTPWYTLAIWNISIPHLLLLRFDKVSTKWVAWVNRVLRTPWFSGTAHGGFHHRNQLRSRRAKVQHHRQRFLFLLCHCEDAAYATAKRNRNFDRMHYGKGEEMENVRIFMELRETNHWWTNGNFPEQRRMPLVWFDQLVKLNTAITDRPPW